MASGTANSAKSSAVQSSQVKLIHIGPGAEQTGPLTHKLIGQVITRSPNQQTNSGLNSVLCSPSRLTILGSMRSGRSIVFAMPSTTRRELGRVGQSNRLYSTCRSRTEVKRQNRQKSRTEVKRIQGPGLKVEGAAGSWSGFISITVTRHRARNIEQYQDASDRTSISSSCLK